MQQADRFPALPGTTGNRHPNAPTIILHLRLSRQLIPYRLAAKWETVMRLRILLVLPFVMALMEPASAKADECDARILHVGNVVQGSRVYSHWRIGHTPWRWATVSFRYQLTYVDEDNRESRVDGRFRQLIRGGEEEYVELKNLRRHPSHITRTKFSDLSCEK